MVEDPWNFDNPQQGKTGGKHFFFQKSQTASWTVRAGVVLKQMFAPPGVRSAPSVPSEATV